MRKSAKTAFGAANAKRTLRVHVRLVYSLPPPLPSLKSVVCLVSSGECANLKEGEKVLNS